MQVAPTTIERAFQLAKSARGIVDLRHRLRLEGFLNAERDLFGATLQKQLKALMPRQPRSRAT